MAFINKDGMALENERMTAPLRLAQSFYLVIKGSRRSLLATLLVFLSACGDSGESYPDIDMLGSWKGNFIGSGYLTGVISNDLDIEITSQEGADFFGRWKYTTDTDWGGYTVTGYLETTPAGNWVYFDLGTDSYTYCVNFNAEKDSYSLYSNTADPDSFSDDSARHYTRSSCYVATGNMTISRL